MIMLPQFLGRIKNAARVLFNQPLQGKYINLPVRRAGVTVDHDTALTYSAYFRAVSLVSQAVAGLPWEVILELGNKKKKMQQHEVWKLLHSRPNREMNSYSFRETIVAHALTWGRGVAEIERDTGGRAVALWLVTPDRVQVMRNAETQELQFVVQNFTREPTVLPAEDVFYLHGLGFNGIEGYSIAQMAARSIGIGLAAEQYSEDFLANGSVSVGGIKHPQTLGDKAYDRLKQQLDNNTMFGHRWRPMVLEEGMEWFDIAIPARDAQLIETRKVQVLDISRWTGVPPHKLMDLDRATFSNIEHQAIEVVGDAVLPWCYRLEQEADAKLLAGPQSVGLRTKLQVRGLMRGDDKTRAEFYKIMREMGVYSANRILDLEDENPVGPEGDLLIVNGAYTPLKALMAQTQTAAPAPQPAQPPAQPQRAQLLAGFAGMTKGTFERILRRASNRFEQNRPKMQGEKAVNQWLQEWAGEHQQYAAAALGPIVDGFAQLAGSPVRSDNGAAMLLQAVVEAHQGRTEQWLKAKYQGETCPEPAEMAAKEAENFLESIAVLAVQARECSDAIQK